MIRTTEELFQKACGIKYPEACNMVPINQQKAIGFFPAGSGFWEGKGTLAEKDILILGQDFNNEAAWGKYRDDPEKSEDPAENKTWRNLIQLLEDLDIAPERCFFSNVFMGLRKGSEKNSGPCPGMRSVEYRKLCLDFLKIQIEAVRPSLIIVLGFYPMIMMREAFGELNTADTWREVGKVKNLFVDSKQVVSIPVNQRQTVVAFVIHPSMNGTNRSLIFGKGKGHEEVEQLKSLLMAHGL